jgi:hypothetical protein
MSIRADVRVQGQLLGVLPLDQHAVQLGVLPVQNKQEMLARGRFNRRAVFPTLRNLLQEVPQTDQLILAAKRRSTYLLLRRCIHGRGVCFVGHVSFAHR